MASAFYVGLFSFSPGMIQEVEGRMRNHLTPEEEGMQPRKLLPNRKARIFLALKDWTEEDKDISRNSRQW